LNHFGHCVTDLDRSIRFYTELFGFEEVRRMKFPDAPADKLLQIEAPLGMTAVYLSKEQVTLELLCFDRSGNPPARARPVNEPGLTHMSFSVDDIPACRAGVEALGGQVLDGTDIGMAVFVRDPDGQLIELLPMSYRDSIG
jgi:catechol 2,3-dioxygenase-like lactoylglutathione lyase family enzyme